MVWIFWAAKKRHFWFQLSEFQEFFFSKNWKVSQNRQNYYSWIIFKSTGQKTGRRHSGGHFEGDSIQFVHSLQTYSAFRRTSKRFWLLPENEINSQKAKPKFSCLIWRQLGCLRERIFSKITFCDNNFISSYLLPEKNKGLLIVPIQWLQAKFFSALFRIWPFFLQTFIQTDISRYSRVEF